MSPLRLLSVIVFLLLPGVLVEARYVETEAAVDEQTQLGVAKVVFPLDAVDDFRRWNSGAGWIVCSRAFYPVRQPPRRLEQLVSRLGPAAESIPREAVIHFLFQGSQPFDITVVGDAEPVRIQPQVKPARHARLLRSWWRNQTEWLEQDSTRSPYPPYVQMYLASVHARRMGLPVPPNRLPLRNLPVNEQTLQLLTGSKDHRSEMFWQVSAGLPVETVPELPLPTAIDWQDSADTTTEALPDMEPMAEQIPADCFYIRFGKYSNLLWLQHLMEEHAAGIGRLMTMRSLDADYGTRIKNQLVVDEFPFAELIGDKVIADVALVGRDLFFREGAALGLVFHENAPVVGNGLIKMRKEKAAEDAQAELTTVKIAGQQVSSLATSDHQVRSFYWQRDEFHFITNSRAMMDRFIRIGEEVGPLAEDASFQQARRQMPLEREDTLFAFLGPKFFQGLLSPQYRIEMQRRIRSRCELDVARLARHAYLREEKAGVFAAAQEATMQPTLDQMIAVKLLPSGFGKRTDRSRPAWVDEDWVDSLRGASGSFLPIPDTPVISVTPEESAEFQALARYHQQQWNDCDPLVVGVQRAKHESQDNLERVTVEARLETLDQTKYGRLARMLGPPTQQQLVCDTPLLGSIQLSLINRLRPMADPHFASGGLLEQQALTATPNGGLLGALALLRTTPGYLSVTGDALLSGRLLDRFREFDEAGYFVGLTGLWRRKHDGLTTLSYQREVLEQVTPELRFETSDEPAAQVRVHVNSLAESQLADWMAAAGRDRARQASLRNVQLLHALTTQLGVEAPAALALAEQLVGARLVCPLGGEFRWEDQQERGAWCSTSWSDHPGEFLREDEAMVPAVLQWCAGLRGRLIQQPSNVTLWAELLLRRQADEPKFEFSPLKFFSRSTASQAAK